MVNDKYFDVHSAYKNQLKSFSKKLFDPFKRHSRLILKHNHGEIDTTLGQLCFFRWCIINHVLEYVAQHHDAIFEHMKRTLVHTGTSTEKKYRKRKSQITVTATRMASPPGVHSIILYFE